MNITHTHTHTLTRRLATALAVLTLASSAWAVPEDQFRPALDGFLQATQGDTSQIEKSVHAFGALLKQEPTNPVLMAYTGAATTMQANTTLLPWKKMSYAEDGLAMLDKALAMLTAAHDAPLQHNTPANLEVRLTAANTFLAVPSFMNRNARGAKLLNDVLTSPLLASSPLEFRAAVWLAAADQAVKESRTEDARKLLGMVISNKAPQAEAARAKLTKIAS